MRILIVEDEPATRQVLALVAKGIGAEVATAADGLEGKELFASFRPHIVVSDIQMPRMDGLALLEEIRFKSPDVLFIVVSTLDAPEYTLRALKARANDYLVKPVLEKDLAALLAKYCCILANRSQVREVVGMIRRRELDMRLDNRIDLIGKVADQLMCEAEPMLSPRDRLGVHLGLVEVLANAIEHGNLGITYAEKGAALDVGDETWERLLRERLAATPFRDRKVTVEFRLDASGCRWSVADEGDGFDWRGVPAPDAIENVLATHGRGIFLARLQFDEMSYSERGNRVTLVKRAPAAPATSDGGPR